VPSQRTLVEVGVQQIQRLSQLHQQHHPDTLLVVAADGSYGNHRFLAPLRDEACALVVRLRRDRVLYRAPGPYQGRGRPRQHGARFAFKEPQTWGVPQQEATFHDDTFGQVTLQLWHDLHARQDAETPFRVLRVQSHQERDTPPAALWLAWQGPSDQDAVAIWRFFQYRQPIESSIRFRKQALYWTTPAFQSNEADQRWSWLVTLAHWTLYLARDLVQDQPLPWQPAHTRLTPRVSSQ